MLQWKISIGLNTESHVDGFDQSVWDFFLLVR